MAGQKLMLEFCLQEEYCTCFLPSNDGVTLSFNRTLQSYLLPLIIALEKTINVTNDICGYALCSSRLMRWAEARKYAVEIWYDGCLKIVLNN